MNASHYIEKCRTHHTVVGQCRCPGPKTTRWVAHSTRCDMAQEIQRQNEERRKSVVSNGADT